MFFRKRRKNEKGSMQIVEAAYVFPIMFFILLILIYMGNAYFIRAQVDAVAETYAIKGAEYCSDPLLATLEDTGTLPSVRELSTQPYRYLIDDMSGIEDGIKGAVISELDGATSFFRNMKPDFSSQNAVDADYKNYILYQTFSVDISYKIKIPLKMLWEKDYYVLSITSHAIAPVNDTAEFVRNTDMVVDLMQGTKVGNGIANAFKKVNDFISNFANKSSSKGDTTKSQVTAKSPTTAVASNDSNSSGSNNSGGNNSGGGSSSNPGVIAYGGDDGSSTGVGTNTDGVQSGTSADNDASDDAAGGDEDGESGEDAEPPSSGGTTVADADDEHGYEAQIPRSSEEWYEYFKERYGEDNVEWYGSSDTVITDADREKLSNWNPKYCPSDELYLKYKTVYDNPKYFNQETGDVQWPDNNGAVEGTTQTVTLKKGETIDRYGGETGHYASPAGTPYSERALCPGSGPYHKYKILKDFDAYASEIAPWFDEEGGGIQYYFDEDSIETLKENGYLVEVFD